MPQGRQRRDYLGTADSDIQLRGPAAVSSENFHPHEVTLESAGKKADFVASITLDKVGC